MSEMHFCSLVCQGNACVRSNNINENVSVQRCQGCRWLRVVRDVKSLFVKPGRSRGPVIWN
ncbi:MAG: hypothetical protein ACFFHD_13730 [Promethearchaeota archaeon]